MSGEWCELPLDDVATVIGGGTPSTKDEGNFNGSIPWLTPKDLSGYPYRYISRGERNISEKGLMSSSARLLPEGAVLLTTRAPVGYVAIASNSVTTNQGFRSLVLQEGFHPEFVYYLLKSKTDLLKAHASGTTFGELSGTTLKGLRFMFPPLLEQRAIAAILGAVDDKIELNRRMNETLEAMAQALFKSWFVDFEPFRDQGTQDSPLGQIPKEWRAGTVGEICDIVMGQSPPGETYNELGNGTPFYQGIRDFGFRFPTSRVFCTAPKRFAQKGDVLLSVRAPVGSLNMAIERCAVGRGVAALRLKSHGGSFPYYLLKSDPSNWEKFEAQGTVFGAVTKADVHGFETILPPLNIVGQFNQIVEPLDAKIELNDREFHPLATIRDTLMPKLLSGEIRVKDAEKFVEVKI